MVVVVVVVALPFATPRIYFVKSCVPELRTPNALSCDCAGYRVQAGA